MPSPLPNLTQPLEYRVADWLVRRGWVVALAFAIAAAVAAVAWSQRSHHVRFATGSRGGTQQAVAGALAEHVAPHVERLTLELQESGGGHENMKRLLARTADFAIVPNDERGSLRVKTVVPLYREYLHVVVRGELARIGDLRGKRVAAGPEGSHSAAVGRYLFGAASTQPAELIHPESHDASIGLLRDGHVDAAVVLAGLPSASVAEMLAIPDARLLSLATPGAEGSILEGLQVNAPYLVAAVIPIGTYGQAPAEAIGTLACDALLVTREDVSTELVHDFTAAIFEQRAALADTAPELARITEQFDESRLRFPIHDGAHSFYTRRDPPMLVEWADAISLSITVALLAWSGVAALHSRTRRQRKDRVDRYYADIQDLADSIHDATDTETLYGLRTRLRALRRQAFAELAAERLAADESFTIFQDYVRSEAAEIDAALLHLEKRERKAKKKDAKKHDEPDDV